MTRAAARSHVRAKVLVVDDEASIRFLCRVNLDASDVEVVEAPDGPTAVELARAERPDLVLLDVMLPGADGWEVARALAEEPETRGIPVVFVTARAEPAVRRRAYELGAAGFVTKPFDPIVLAETVLGILEERGLRG